MTNSKKKIIFMLSFLGFLFLFVIGISYAYYVGEVKGNTSENPSLKLTSGYLSIVYDSGTSKISGGSTEGTTQDLVYTKTFSITNDGVADSNFGIWIKNYQVLDSEGNESAFERTEDWTYVLKAGETIIKTGTFPKEDESIISVYPLSMGETINLTFTLTYDYITAEEGGTNQTADMGKVLSFDIGVVQSINHLNNTNEGTLLYAINEQYQSSIIRNEADLSTIPGQAPSLETESILATTEDDYGTSYYYRGNVQNNYVTYSNMCWRIVRVQGDGTIKLILEDETSGCNVTSDTHTKIPTINNGEIYAYSEDYTDSGLYANSEVPALLASWKQSKITNTSVLETTNWCNDTSVTELENHYYGAYNRLVTNTSNTTLKCNIFGITKNNLLTTSTKYPSDIGILSADEVAFAGGKFNNLNQNYYLYVEGFNYWTMTPYSYYNEIPIIFVVKEDNNNYALTNDTIDNGGIGIRPAITLKKDVMISEKLDESVNGEHGSSTNPYVIE